MSRLYLPVDRPPDYRRNAIQERKHAQNGKNGRHNIEPDALPDEPRLWATSANLDRLHAVVECPERGHEGGHEEAHAQQEQMQPCPDGDQSPCGQMRQRRKTEPGRLRRVEGFGPNFVIQHAELSAVLIHVARTRWAPSRPCPRIEDGQAEQSTGAQPARIPAAVVDWRNSGRQVVFGPVPCAY